MSARTIPLEVFCSYVDVDEPLLDILVRHLSLLQREDLIVIWHKRQLLPGTDWEEALDHHMNLASVILLLVSPDFLASDYCYSIEMQRAMQRHEANEARVIPILLRPSDWQNAPFGKLKVLPNNEKPITEWRNRDAAFLDVTEGIRAVLEGIQQLSISTPPTALPRFWNIPYSRNPVFTGREEVFRQLVASLKTGQPAALSQPQAISGLGGIGKTQIAIEYAYRYHQQYQAILWARAESTEALVSSYVTLAALLNLPEKDTSQQMITVQAVKDWLRTHSEWLLILDNADDLALVGEFLPPVFDGHILLTTRAQVMGRLARSIEVGTMDYDVGTVFLLRRAGLIEQDTSLEASSPFEVTSAREICIELGGLPLALDQAGAYIEETQCGIVDFLQLYRLQRAKLLKMRGGLVTDHPEPVATTWSISFTHIEEKYPAAADLLRLCSFLHADAIPLELFFGGAGAENLGPALATALADPMGRNKAIAELRAYSLVKRDAEQKTLSVHRLVQAVLQDEMDPKTYQLWLQRVICLLQYQFPEEKFSNWSDCERFLPHALKCAELMKQSIVNEPVAPMLLISAGQYLLARTRYKEAELIFTQTLTLCNQMPEVAHLFIEPIHRGFGILYNALGQFSEAEKHLQIVQLQVERTWGSGSHADAANLNNMGNVYFEQGDFKHAEEHLKRALAICEHYDPVGTERTLVEKDSVLSSLGMVYWRQGRLNEAESLFNQAVLIRKSTLEPDHPKMATILNNLGLIYNDQHKVKEAEVSFQRAVDICERQLGHKDERTAFSLSNLAIIYMQQGQYAKAEPMMKRAIYICADALGPTNPKTEEIKAKYELLKQAKKAQQASQSFSQNPQTKDRGTKKRRKKR